jgi:hypothetical protein
MPAQRARHVGLAALLMLQFVLKVPVENDATMAFHLDPEGV